MEQSGSILILQKNLEIHFTLKIHCLEKTRFTVTWLKYFEYLSDVWTLKFILLSLNTNVEFGWYQLSNTKGILYQSFFKPALSSKKEYSSNKSTNSCGSWAQVPRFLYFQMQILIFFPNFKIESQVHLCLLLKRLHEQPFSPWSQ